MTFSNPREIADSLSYGLYHLIIIKYHISGTKEEALQNNIEKGLKFIVSLTTVRFVFGKEVSSLTLFKSSRSFFFCTSQESQERTSVVFEQRPASGRREERRKLTQWAVMLGSV